MDPARPSLIYERSPINETSSNSHLPCLTDQEVWDALADILALDVRGVSLLYCNLLLTYLIPSARRPYAEL